MKQSKSQTEILAFNSKILNRPYLDISITKFDTSNPFKHRYPITDINGTIRINIRNRGRTPAIPILVAFHVDSLSTNQLNLRDTLLINKKLLLDTDNENLPEIFPQDFEYPHGITFTDKRTNLQGYLYVHNIILYKDSYDDCHDFYSITPCVFDTARRGRFDFPARISMHDWSEKEVKRLNKILNKNNAIER
jgi:hypothetical protein